MSERSSFNESGDSKENNHPTTEVDRSNEGRAGAACLEIIESQERKMKTSEHEENDEDFTYPLPPPCSPSLSNEYDIYFSSLRRYSYFPGQQPQNKSNSRYRAPSLPIIGVTQVDVDNNESNFKKLLFDSRRSSYESAYHSHASERSSRTPITRSQIEDLETSQDYTDNIFNLTAQSMLEEISFNDSLDMTLTERRDSLSYEAIRAYFLECNPYMTEYDINTPCSEHANTPSVSLFCPNCNIRRNSLEHINIHFRTSAHRQVVERQFEDLFNIPDSLHSRSTSVDLFGGIDIPSTIQEQNDNNNNNNSTEFSFDGKQTHNTENNNES